MQGQIKDDPLKIVQKWQSFAGTDVTP